MNKYIGIDYGHGMTNIDKNTGIRYGVIPMNSLCDWAYDEFTPEYGNPYCPKCGADLSDSDQYEEKLHCHACDTRSYPEQCSPDEAIAYTYETPATKASFSDDGDVFIELSPYYTRAAFCSPCAPGACYITDHCQEGERAYCFNHDWFEGDVAPYPVYRVSDNTLVQPKEN